MTTSETGRGRYAPSPSGPLHLGNLRTALLAWLFARHAGASFVLRLEDLDRPRVKHGAADQILRDLRWLGLDWDEGPDLGGPFAPYTQSERMHFYVEHTQRLLEADLAYPCYCSRADIEQAASAPHGLSSAASIYPGTCREPALRNVQRRKHPERRPAYRFRVTGQAIAFIDGLRGPMTARLEPGADDFVIWRFDGTPAYQLAVVVDDALMRIQQIVRADDLLDSTPRQIALYQAFNYAIPSFAHVPLLRDATGARLAKRDAAAGITMQREAGAPPEAIVGMLAASCGLAPAGIRCAPAELLPTFSPVRLRNEVLV
jgi:glutamyl-tRNA synthetase